MIESRISAKVIKDSIGDTPYPTYNTRLITLEIEYPKFLQAQLNTHRNAAKNAASSRAMPMKVAMENLFVPTVVGKNKPGMVATEYLEGIELESFQKDWIDLKDYVYSWALDMANKYSVHKQTINRVLEPFMMSKGVFTATFKYWKHVIGLRKHLDAQPEFYELADLIEKAIYASEPQRLKQGQWHLPYVDSVEAGEKDVNIKVSASCIAQVSYRKLDDSLEKALSIFDKLNLISDDPDNHPHISPVQHVSVFYPNKYSFNEDVLGGTHSDKPYYAEFVNYIQCSKFIENLNKLNPIGVYRE